MAWYEVETRESPKVPRPANLEYGEETQSQKKWTVLDWYLGLSSWVPWYMHAYIHIQEHTIYTTHAYNIHISTFFKSISNLPLPVNCHLNSFYHWHICHGMLQNVFFSLICSFNMCLMSRTIQITHSLIIKNHLFSRYKHNQFLII